MAIPDAMNSVTVVTMTLSPTARSTLRRHRERAGHDPAELHALLESALICHLGLVLDDSPWAAHRIRARR
jgi:hypothetical protein